MAALSPSQLGGAHALPGEGLDTAEAKAWGAALHVLLERLPEIPSALWPQAASRLSPAALAARLLDEASGVIATPELRPLFAGGALAEVDVAGPVAALGGRRIAGRIDRLVVSDDAVLAVDFKSNRVVPETPAQTPEAILRQMGAYAAALAQIWQGRRIETAVLWTRARRLVRLPSQLTAAAIDRAAVELAAGPRLDPAGARP